MVPRFQRGIGSVRDRQSAHLLPFGVMVSTTDFDSVCKGSSPLAVTFGRTDPIGAGPRLENGGMV